MPSHTTVVYVGQTPYYYVNGTYYVATELPPTTTVRSARRPRPQPRIRTTAKAQEAADEIDEIPMVEFR